MVQFSLRLTDIKRVKPRFSKSIMIKSCEDKISLKSRLISLKLYSSQLNLVFSWLNLGLLFCEGYLQVWLCFTDITLWYWKILQLIFYSCSCSCFSMFISVIENCIFYQCKFLCQKKVNFLFILLLFLKELKNFCHTEQILTIKGVGVVFWLIWSGVRLIETN